MRLTAALLLWLVAPARSAVPTPESHFGHRMGEDRRLVAWDQVVAYFQALEKSSDRLRTRVIGKTVDGKPMIAATISSPATLRQLDRYQHIQRRLADPRRTPEEEAARLVIDGKAVVMITCSIHSTEVASTMTAVEFAWRLLAEEKPRFRAILDNVIFILVPSLNPDGVDIVADWYRRTLGSPHEGTTPPELYHRYIGHDNNRDWYIFSQPETRHTVTHLHNAWHPQIVYDVHQQGPFASRMFVPPWMDPIDPNIDPRIAQYCNWIGMGVAADLTAAGKTGVAVNAIYDFWTPARHYQAYHGGLRILTESASARLATPIVVRPDQILQTAPGYHPRESTWNHLEPWLGGEWRLRDIVDYQLIAFESVLYQAATRREDLLWNFYRIGERAVKRAKPHAFVVPSRQFDPGATRKMLETLAFGQVEIDRARDSFQAGGRVFPSGSYVIRMQQPYSSFAKTLLERQDYPDLRLYPGGPPKRPYDVTAHSLPLLMGVDTVAVEEPFTVRAERAASFPALGLTPAPRGVLPAADVDSWKAANRTWRAGGGLWRDRAGSFRTAQIPGGQLVGPPRIGVYRSHVPSMDEGWTRWILEQFGFAYSSPRNADLRAGRLREKYDALLFPDQSAAVIARGYAEGAMPPEYTGGLGREGADALRQFAADGGTLIFLNQATEYAVEQFSLPVRNVVQSASDRDFYSPGSLLNVSLDTAHPLARGLPADLAVWSERSPAWEVAPGSGARVVARYPPSSVLASGWLLGERMIAGRAALVEAPMGKGRVILFGMRPQYRGQSYRTFKLLFNALMYF
jgi:hypothetical protein